MIMERAERSCVGSRSCPLPKRRTRDLLTRTRGRKLSSIFAQMVSARPGPPLVLERRTRDLLTRTRGRKALVDLCSDGQRLARASKAK